MLDRLGNEVDFTELFMEETLTAKDKKELPDSMYGLVYTDEKGNKVRKFPLKDESHVRQAAIFFNRAKDLTEDQKRELARNIVRRAKELNMDYSGWESLKPYLDEPVKESYGPDPDSTSGTSEFDESHNDDPDDCFCESFEEMFGPVIQEAFDAITGKEIPITKAYTMDQMKRITLHNDEMMHVAKPPHDEVYFGSDINYMPEMDLDGPLFVVPYKDLASIFSGRNELKKRLRGLSYNLQYEEWSNFNERKDHNPLKVVHVYVEGVPDLDPFVLETEGYIHCILTRDYEDNFYKYPWMDSKEYLIAKTDNMKVQFFRQIKCRVKYIVEGRMMPKGKKLPSRLQIAKNIAEDIHEYVEKMAKEPTGNQNCLLCTWCAEAQFRGRPVLPRPVYSPRDMIFKYTNVECVKGGEKKRPRGFDNLMEMLFDAGMGDHRWYCHVDWEGGTGGHEFLILKIDGKFYIMDAQQGKVEPLSDDHSYFTDIEWKGSFIVRLNNKPFDFDLLKRVNDPANALPWDPAKDIPYMKKHDMGIQESADSLVLFKQLPKDLQEFLENGDYSMIRREDDSFYVVAGYWVEDFYKPSELELCGEAYSLESDDPYYNAIIFSYENSNSFGFNPKDKSYYYFYHDEYEVKNGKEYIEPYKLKQKTWGEIIKAIPKERVYYRFEYEGEGIYEAYKRHATWLQWHEFKQTYAASWLNIVPNYRSGEKSYFTEEGYKMFMEHTYPEMIKVLDESKIKEIRVNLKPEDIRYEDKYQATTKAGISDPEPIQESVFNELRNGVIPWSNKRVFHISKDGHLDGQVFKPRVPDYLDKYDPSKDKFEDVDNPRVCFSPSIDGCLNAIIVSIGRWKTVNRLGDWYVYVPEKPLDQYKHRTTKALVKEKKVYDANITDEIWIEEPVRLKQYGIIHVDQVSNKHTKKTVPTTSGFQGRRYKYNFKWRWLVKPKILSDLPFTYTPESVCEDMVDYLENFKYGLGSNGSIHSASSKEYDEKYRLESPEEFDKNGGGICYDYVEFMEGYLDAYGYKCRKFYISTDTKDMDTHTFILVDNGDGKFIYPESAFKLLKGVHKVKSPEEAALKVMDKVFDINDNRKKYDEIKYYVWEYEGHPPYGSNMETCHKYFSKGEPFHEGIAKKIK